MVDILRKNKYKKVLYSWPVIVFLLVMLFVAARASWHIYEKKQSTYEKLSAVQQEYQELKARHSQMKKKVEQLKTKRGLEAAMRERFGVAKQGERVVYILEEEEVSTNKDTDTAPSFWSRVQKFFGF